MDNLKYGGQGIRAASAAHGVTWMFKRAGVASQTGQDAGRE